MQRRAFLATGLTLLAGCGQQDDSPAATSPTATTVATSTSTETPTATETDTPTETETPTETDTPTPDPRAELIDEAITHIEEGLINYSLRKPLDSRDITRDASTEDIRNELYDARDLLKEAEDESLTDEQQNRLRKAWKAYWFTWWIGPAHNQLHEAVDGVTDDWDDVSRSSVLESLEEFENYRGNIDSDSGETGFDVLADVSTDEYADCLDRLDNLASDAKNVLNRIRDHREADSTYYDGLNHHKAESYRSASTDFASAREAFEDNVDSLEGRDYASPFSDQVDGLLCYDGVMAERSDEFRRAADYGDEGEHERRIAIEEGAPEPSDECDW